MKQKCLHLIMAGNRKCLKDCLQFAGNEDSIILIASAVDLLMDDEACHLIAGAYERGLLIAFRAADVNSRGLSEVARSDDVELLEDEAWVTAVCDHSETLSWT